VAKTTDADVRHDPEHTSVAHPRKRVELKKLRPAPYNPPGRTEEAGLGDLMESLRLHGQLNDIIVRSDNTIVMGHRRWAAATLLGWRTLWATVRDDLDMDVMYAEDFATAKRMSSNDALGVWLKNPRAVPARIGQWFESMTRSLGRPLVQRMHRAGYGIVAYRRAKQVATYIERGDDPAWLTKIIQWIMEYEMSAMVQQVMARGGTPSTIRRAIEQGCKLKMEASLADD
jgi:hypothetical protein